MPRFARRGGVSFITFEPRTALSCTHDSTAIALEASTGWFAGDVNEGLIKTDANYHRFPNPVSYN
jgi:hypothetical protein